MVLKVFVRNATPELEEKVGNAINALMEKEFLGQSYRIEATRGEGKEWL